MHKTWQKIGEKQNELLKSRKLYRNFVFNIDEKEEQKTEQKFNNQ